MEERYDLSFMKEYAKIFERDNRWLAAKFNCGVKIVDKILDGELKLKQGPLEEIMYEFGYTDYEKFKKEIIRQTNERKKHIQEREIFSPIKYNFNSMNNKDRIVISILCENNNASIKKITDALELNNYNIKEVIKTNMLMHPRTYISKEEEKIVVSDGVHCKTPTSEIFNYNLMSGKDRIIISMLCDDDTLFSIKQIAELTGYDEEYIKNIYKIVISNISYVSKLEKEIIKTKV